MYILSEQLYLIWKFRIHKCYENALHIRSYHRHAYVMYVVMYVCQQCNLV